MQPLMLSMEHLRPVSQTCSEACPVFEMSGRQEIYRPIFRSEVLRRIYRKYIKPGGTLAAKFTGDIDLNWGLSPVWPGVLSLHTLPALRLGLPIGVNSDLIRSRIRKLFSQEMGIAPKGTPTRARFSI